MKKIKLRLNKSGLQVLRIMLGHLIVDEVAQMDRRAKLEYITICQLLIKLFVKLEEHICFIEGSNEKKISLQPGQAAVLLLNRESFTSKNEHTQIVMDDILNTIDQQMQ